MNGACNLSQPGPGAPQPCSRPRPRPPAPARSQRAGLEAGPGPGSEALAAAEREGRQARGGGGWRGEGSRREGRHRSSWDAKRSGAERGEEADFLSNLGSAQEYNINVDHGQNATQIDSLYAGHMLGLKSDIADGSLRGYEFRRFDHIVGDYYIAPAFLDAIAMHLAKNYLKELGAFDTQTQVPLILGVWGGKGQGKTFQTELAFKKMGVEAVIMSAGELEHEWAGTPGKMIRERYRKASDMGRVRGRLACLVINDIDAGIGIFEDTQRTVNNQMVVGTLMNLCDAPNTVSVGQKWREGDYLRRVPIIVTGNDLSTLFAPLIRDGRMSKFYWQPTREDLVNILHQMYKDDGMSKGDMAALLERFPGQALDFYGALRAATYDGQIRRWIEEDVIKGDLAAEDANMKELSRRLINREGLPTFEPVRLHLEDLMAEGHRLATEQDAVNQLRLSDEYMRGRRGKTQRRSMIGFSG